MRISQLIEKLQALQAEHGDTVVVSGDTGRSWPATKLVAPIAMPLALAAPPRFAWQAWATDPAQAACRGDDRCAEKCVCEAPIELMAVTL